MEYDSFTKSSNLKWIYSGWASMAKERCVL